MALNLTRYPKIKRGKIGLIEAELATFSKLPLISDIIGRYIYLSVKNKLKKERIKKIALELLKLWDSFNFPSNSIQRIAQKV